MQHTQGRTCWGGLLLFRLVAVPGEERWALWRTYSTSLLRLPGSRKSGSNGRLARDGT